MTLTEMLTKEVRHPEPVKEVFKQWLKEVSLGKIFEDSIIAQNMRHDFIMMVDVPSKEDCSASL